MPRPEKVQAVADIKERLDGAQAVFLAEYAGLSVQEQQTLRRELRANGAEFKVVKMTLARLAAADMEIDDFDALLLGPTGLTFADGDPVGAAKVLRDFAKTHEVLVVKGGLLGREFLTPERIAELAEIEPREVLLAKIAGAFEAPMAKMAGLLAALPRNAATAMQQLLEKKEAESSELPATSDQPEAEAGSDEEPAEDVVVVAEETVEETGTDAEVAVDETVVVVEEAVEETVTEAEAAVETAEPEADAGEPEAEPTEGDDEAMAAEASDEDAGSESKDPDGAADDAAEEE
jgi:large subunit ribosomal protein L10